MKAIEVENLSKLYYLGGKMSGSLREAISSFGKQNEKQELWALKDVNFAVNKGETLGIVGKNGAGKSTLLKILSRVTKPTSGSATLHGRVGSLLEVGTGFHNELSGRENIFLNGAILGMHRAEIAAKFDEIVAFAEVEKFIDTPVKHYSSGMFMRLAFAVAAHLETEILIVDEVLAVGDVSFQKKCLGKMQDIREQGRTVLFVSHDTSAVTRICNRAIALDSGKVKLQGTAAEVVRDYLNASWSVAAEKDFENEIAVPQSEFVRLKNVRVIDENHQTRSSHDIRRKIGLQATYEVLETGEILLPNFQIYNQDRVHVFTVQDVTQDWQRRKKEKGEYKSTVWIPANFMAEGTFFLNFAIVTYLPANRIHFNSLDVVSFDVIDSVEGDTARGDYAGNMGGVIRPKLDWETQFQVKSKENFQRLPKLKK
jgi:lipopolysaccharide transport system ATP-binding protein